MKDFTTLLLVAGLATVAQAAVINKRAEDCEKVLVQPQSFTFGPTSTVYTTTSTVTESIDCGTCNKVKPTVLAFGPGPVVHFEATTTVAEPALETAYVCQTEQILNTDEPHRQYGLPVESTVVNLVEKRTRTSHVFYAKRSETPKPTPTSVPHSEYIPEQFRTTTVTPKSQATPCCTTSTEVDPEVENSTLTVYPSTVTSTATVECGGCHLEFSTGVIYYFAPITYTSTITAATPSTKMNFACATA